MAALVLLLVLVTGHDNSPLKPWFDSLQSRSGLVCCNNADGKRLEDVDWRMVGGGYQVRVDGVWRDVPSDAVVETKNWTGVPFVWIYQMKIRCFLPGTEG